MIYLIRKSKIFLIALLTLMLSFSPTCYANTDNGLDISEKIKLTAMVGGIAGLGLLSFFLFKSKDKNNDQAVSTIQKPVVMSSSIDSLLSIDGQKTTGKIIVKNTLAQPVAGFTIEKISGAVTVDVDTTNSSCLDSNIIPSGETCTFNISYTGNGATETRTPIVFKIGTDPNISDFIAISTIDMPLNRFFKPDKDTTGAKNFSPYTSLQSIASTTKNDIPILYVGSFGDGVYKSTDEGVNWIEVNNGLTEKKARVLHIVDGGPNAGLYAGTVDGIFKSVNGGANWIEISGALPSKDIWAIHSIGDDLYIGLTDNYGVFKRNSGGTDWDEFNGGSLNDKNIRDLHSIGNQLYVSTMNGVFETDSSFPGGNWSDFNTGLPTNTWDLHSINNDLYVTISGAGGGVFKRTVDDATNWSSFNTGISPTELVYAYVLHAIGNNLYLGLIGNNSSSILVTDTTSGTANWTTYNTSLPPINISVQSLYSIGNDLYAGMDYGKLFKRNIGVTNWSLLNTGLTDSNVNDIISIGRGPYKGLYAGTDDGVFKSIDGGATWLQRTLAGENVQALHSIDEVSTTMDGLYAGTSNGVFKSTDGGATWPQHATTPTNVNTIKSINDILYAASYIGVSKSTDGGNTWTPNRDLNIRTFSLLTTDNNSYAGTMDGVWKTYDNGATWIYQTSALLKVFALESMNLALYAGTDKGVFKTTDGGATWPHNTLQAFSINSIVSLGGVLYAGTTSKSVYKSTDGGATWPENILPVINDVLTLHTIDNAHCGCDTHDLLYMGVLKNGIYKNVLN